MGFINFQDIEFSVDMVRLECTVPKDFNLQLSKVLGVTTSPYVKYWEKFGFKDYRHNFSYDDGEVNFWVGYEFNLADKLREDSRTVVIEYNPNKNELVGILFKLLNSVNNMRKSDWKVKGVDVALDLKGVPRNSVFYDKGYRKNYREFYSNGSRTTYLGNRGWGGIKIYDKAKEQGLEGDWTRVEYTIKLNLELEGYKALKDIEQDMGYIWTLDVSKIDDVTTKALYICLQNGDIDIGELSPYMKRKLRKLADSHSLVIDNDIKKYICKTIITYLDTFVKILRVPTLPF